METAVSHNKGMVYWLKYNLHNAWFCNVQACLCMHMHVVDWCPNLPSKGLVVPLIFFCLSLFSNPNPNLNPTPYNNAWLANMDMWGWHVRPNLLHVACPSRKYLKFVYPEPQTEEHLFELPVSACGFDLANRNLHDRQLSPLQGELPPSFLDGTRHFSLIPCL